MFYPINSILLKSIKVIKNNTVRQNLTFFIFGNYRVLFVKDLWPLDLNPRLEKNLSHFRENWDNIDEKQQMTNLTIFRVIMLKLKKFYFVNFVSIILKCYLFIICVSCCCCTIFLWPSKWSYIRCFALSLCAFTQRGT